MTAPRMEDLDRDEALTGAVAELYGSDRATFIRRATLGSAGMLAILAAPAAVSARVNDTQILNFGLRFERLQATFYTQAEELGTVASMSAAKQEWARTLGAHERAHVKIIKQVLGRRAEGRPFFDFGDATQTDDAFTRTAVAMEDLTVALLTGVTPKIRNRGLTAALFGLLTVEARHAAWARSIVGSNPAPAAFDEPRSVRSVQGAVDRTRFIARPPRTAGRARPGFSG
jgi:Ferritin-like domain